VLSICTSAEALTETHNVHAKRTSWPVRFWGHELENGEQDNLVDGVQAQEAYKTGDREKAQKLLKRLNPDEEDVHGGGGGGDDGLF
jgi:hypothetical protein